MNKLCKICGKPIPPHHSMYCSQDCYLEMNRIKNRQNNVEKKYTKDMTLHYCNSCGIAFYDGKSLFCEKCRSVRSRKNTTCTACHKNPVKPGNRFLCEFCFSEGAPIYWSDDDKKEQAE